MNIPHLSQQIAERMGWRKCETRFPGLDDRWSWHIPLTAAFGPCGTRGEPTRTGCQLPTNEPWDVTNANDREEAIAWLNVRGLRVTTVRYAAGGAAVEIRTDYDGGIVGTGGGEIEEAFGGAFLEAAGNLLSPRRVLR